MVDNDNDDTLVHMPEPKAVVDQEELPEQHVSDSEEEQVLQERPQRHRLPPNRLADYELISKIAVNSGELIHFALLADVKPHGYVEALK